MFFYAFCSPGRRFATQIVAADVFWSTSTTSGRGFYMLLGLNKVSSLRRMSEAETSFEEKDFDIPKNLNVFFFVLGCIVRTCDTLIYGLRPFLK